MVKCEHCKDEFEHYDTVCINHGIEGKEFRICYGCAEVSNKNEEVRL